MNEIEKTINEITEFDKKASPAPWKSVEHEIDGYIADANDNSTAFGGESCEGYVSGDDPDVKLVIAMRNSLPAILETLREKQEREQREAPKPLTLEELMEMTREPVYDADDGYWYVIDYVNIVDELSTLIVMTDSTEFDSENGLPKFYRTKPEESEKE